MRLDRPAYIVYSWRTPIAFYSPTGNRWIIPDVHYSHSTDIHQGKIKAAIKHLANEGGSC